MKDKSISIHNVRIYQEDVDSGGIVYHSHYLKYAERARTEWLREMGLEQSILKSEQSCHFVVVHLDIHYKSPARLDDLLEIRSGLCRVEGIRLVMCQKIFKKERMCVDMSVTLALINNEGRPMRLPNSIVKILPL